MLFPSIVFLYCFLPITLVIYFLTPKNWRNIVLLLASLIFYAFGEPIYVLILLISSVSDYCWSLLIEKNRKSPKKSRRFLIASIVINLGILCFFKYTDFFIETINYLLQTSIPLTKVPLPIGISFFTFQTMSYTIDVYRGKTKAQHNLATFATFVCLFPQLIAGPIVRYTDLEKELKNRTITIENVASGIRRFVFGLGKKVIIANAMGELCTIFRTSNDQSIMFYWLYAVAFTLQIYFDFSGYSDMAIGLGKVFGFNFPENFNYPYISKSITEFWRRWHMTLGGWFRDYVYIPLGGNQTSKFKWLRNIAVVWLLTGLWHGANWNFVLWGGFFGVLLIVEKLWLQKILDKLPLVIRHIYVMFCVIISFVIFNASDLGEALGDLKALFGFSNLPMTSFDSIYYLKSYGNLLILAMIASMPLGKNIYSKFENNKIVMILEPVAVVSFLVVVTAYLVDGSFNPFLYFRF